MLGPVTGDGGNKRDRPPVQNRRSHPTRQPAHSFHDGGKTKLNDSQALNFLESPENRRLGDGADGQNSRGLLSPQCRKEAWLRKKPRSRELKKKKSFPSLAERTKCSTKPSRPPKPKKRQCFPGEEKREGKISPTGDGMQNRAFGSRSKEM